ncbi:MAG: twin-arginine translocase TatA/TatE family subunit [Candidatus Cryptobacteroides sp.]
MTFCVLPLMIGTTELIVLAGCALLLFGGKKLPGLMKNLGRGVKEFKDGVSGAPDDFKKGLEENQSDDNPDSEQQNGQQEKK